jgi:hypothetical protein
MSAYLSAHIEECHRSGHRFIVAGSDKTPMKRNLICVTCTDRNPGKTVYCAYGVDTQSWGDWHTSKIHEPEPIDVSEP